jgi:hypothetical protein
MRSTCCVVPAGGEGSGLELCGGCVGLGAMVVVVEGRERGGRVCAQ